MFPERLTCSIVDTSQVAAYREASGPSAHTSGLKLGHTPVWKGWNKVWKWAGLHHRALINTSISFYLLVHVLKPLAWRSFANPPECSEDTAHFCSCRIGTHFSGGACRGFNFTSNDFTTRLLHEILLLTEVSSSSLLAHMPQNCLSGVVLWKLLVGHQTLPKSGNFPQAHLSSQLIWFEHHWCWTSTKTSI